MKPEPVARSYRLNVKYICCVLVVGLSVGLLAAAVSVGFITLLERNFATEHSYRVEMDNGTELHVRSRTAPQVTKLSTSDGPRWLIEARGGSWICKEQPTVEQITEAE